MSKGWDSAALKKLKALTGKGLSTSEIGKRLGMSKNAIVGKLNRLGWNAKAGGANATDDKKADVKKSTPKKVATKKAEPVKKTNAKKRMLKRSRKRPRPGLRKLRKWHKKQIPKQMPRIWRCINVLFSIRWKWQI